MYDDMNIILLNELKAIKVQVYYYGTEESAHFTPMPHHNHEVYEMYVNLSGDVSFVVNDTCYPVQAGDVILSRPFEYHYCITTNHRHFCLFFSNEGASQIFENFLATLGSHIVIPLDKKQRFLSVCHKLLEKELSQLAYLRNVLELLYLLSYGSSGALQYESTFLPPDITATMQLIEKNLSQHLTVKDMAKNAHVSINTLERHFKNWLYISPYEYLNQKRLARACILLSEGINVQITCDSCGFSDYSHFIMLFKKQFGITPLQYQKTKESL